MATKPKAKDKAPAEAPQEPEAPVSNVTVHLDRDPNDPRKQGDTKQLPSLDDESQQTPKSYKGVPG